MAKAKPLAVTQADLHHLFDLRNGELFWKNPPDRCLHKAGKLAGRLVQNGRWQIKINGREYKRARLVWLYIHGHDPYPELQIDHKNRIPHDDRIDNLRAVTFGQNQSNRAWGVSAHRYVSFTDGKWRARPKSQMTGKRKHLGLFNTEKEAIEAVNKWESING